jgi:hypothetical protein
MLQPAGIQSSSGSINGLGDPFYAHSAINIYLKKEQTYPILGGLAVGILVALVGVYLYNKGNMRFPQPGSTTSASDRIRFDDSNRPTKGTLLVRGNNVAMRNCPGLNCREINFLQMGTPVEDLGESYFQDNVDWIKIRAGARDGWVSRTFLE